MRRRPREENHGSAARRLGWLGMGAFLFVFPGIPALAGVLVAAGHGDARFRPALVGFAFGGALSVAMRFLRRALQVTAGEIRGDEP